MPTPVFPGQIKVSSKTGELHSCHDATTGVIEMSPKQSRSENRRPAEAIVRSDDCRRLKAATHIKYCGLLNHAPIGDRARVAAFSASGSAGLPTLGRQPKPARYFRIARIRQSADRRRPSQRRLGPASRLQRNQRGNDGPDYQSVPSSRRAQVSPGRLSSLLLFFGLALVPRHRWRFRVAG
jgi:hypothetical protein